MAPRQVQHPGIAGGVAEVLDSTGLAPHCLHLELTERTVIDVAGGIAQTLSSLADLGVRIAIDDFGTGYSNLACLLALPVHGLKLDRTITRRRRGMDVGRDDDFLATAVSLGHTLGLTVTAEGIETAAQARRMRAARCDNGQGWYLGRPVPADQMTWAIQR
jgi:EAL domain-containing protein (putative c-di-GMP-specific phosphodiesterase class I)